MPNTTPSFAPQQEILTVSQLNRETNRLLSSHFMEILVEGEISNLSTPSSGHIYFSLKDANAQIRCAMFKTQLRRIIYRPENGKQVIIKAQVSLYEPRGDYQLIVEYIEEAGIGVLRRAFDRLKQKLLDEGLFASSNKQSLPALPRYIGIITSPTGAAIKDILTVLKRRFPAIPAIIYPTSVQGELAKFEIAKAIATANQHRQCDVIILARGGGSLEDLWAFNEETVARAIFASQIPIISGVGHETDVTIADFVADLRAATPSAAAEHAAPDQQQWLSAFISTETLLSQQLQRKLSLYQQKLLWVQKRLQQQHPGQKLIRNAQRLDELELRLNQTIQNKLAHNANTLEAKTAKLWQFDPSTKLLHLSQKYEYVQQNLSNTIQTKIKQLHFRLNNASQTLHAVSPLATLNRGYALASKADSGQIIQSASELSLGESVNIRLGKGQFTSEVKAIQND